MPLYEYKCEKCEAVFEVLQKFSDAPLKVHAGCGGAVERLLTAPSFQFKGSGWYVTDYAKKGGSNGGAHAAKGDSSGAAAASDGKGAAKEPASSAKDSTTSKSETKAAQPVSSSSKS